MGTWAPANGRCPICHGRLVRGICTRPSCPGTNPNEGTALSILSVVAVARVAERHIREHGPTEATDLLDQLAAITATPDRAEAGLRRAITTGRLELDRDGTLRLRR